MKRSVEEKIKMIDKLIEYREQVIAMQETMGIVTALDKNSNIMVYQPEDFFGLYKQLDAGSIRVARLGDSDSVECSFFYKGVRFNVFMSSQQVKRFDNRLVIP